VTIRCRDARFWWCRLEECAALGQERWWPAVDLEQNRSAGDVADDPTGVSMEGDLLVGRKIDLLYFHPADAPVADLCRR